MEVRDLHLPVGIHLMAVVADAVDEGVLVEAEQVTPLSQ